METVRTKFNFNFMARRKLTSFISAAFILFSIISLAFNGLNFGIDFTGGTLVEVSYKQAADTKKIRNVLGDSGYDDAIVQYFGSANDILIRVPLRENVSGEYITDDLLKLLSQEGKHPELRRVEFVGPQIGEELRDDGGLAMLYALMGIFIYVALRFQKYLSVGAIAALVHDVIITLGFFSVFQIEFDLTVLAAILAVIGYSLNDTIVIFDRVRENFRKLREETSHTVFNISLNETLSRTIITGVTTLLVLFSLFIFGGETIRGFSVALIVGVIVGTYSSIYVASPVVLSLGIKKIDFMPVQKEGVNDL